ncbi:MAG: hypothetical protein JWN75_132 [Candidatus Saccharibacteria bacterium]|nr:hypothetical protein [Candidatus Saccharibacteria bacterium]
MRFGGREEWGSSYYNGDLVLAWIDGQPQVVVVTSHTGDCHHHYMAVQVEKVIDDEHGQRDQLVGDPARMFHGYYAGPRVGHLEEEQLLMLAAGIVVPELRVECEVTKLLRLEQLKPTARERTSAS